MIFIGQAIKGEGRVVPVRFSLDQAQHGNSGGKYFRLCYRLRLQVSMILASCFDHALWGRLANRLLRRLPTGEQAAIPPHKSGYLFLARGAGASRRESLITHVHRDTRISAITWNGDTPARLTNPCFPRQ